MSKVSLIAALCCLFAAGCSDLSPQRMGYAAVSEIGRQQCQRQSGADPSACSDRPSYDEYQRSRQK